ncbi:MAG TPA: FAD-dependent oxidoreductase [Polyangiales bacterium]|nr:FAD-dependent oxidoreductase [Polyangiales bacterium]
MHESPPAPALSIASLSDVRLARLIDREQFACSQWLRFETTERALHFRGGHYVIVETGLLLPNGKPRRRAYSIVSSDRDSEHFELTVFRLPSGEGCAMMSQLERGDALHFSAPWGKLHPPASGPVWLVATDSGMSAALGLIAAREYAVHEQTVVFGWSVADTFLDPDWIRTRLDPRVELELRTLGPTGTTVRTSEVRQRLLERLAHARPEHVYLLGDGEVARQLQPLLIEHGVAADRIQSESFFNHVAKPANKS